VRYSLSNELDRPFTTGFIRSIDSAKLGGANPDHVAVDETVIQLNDEQYWLYAAFDPETNEWLHIKLEPTTTTILAQSFLTNSPRNTMSLTPCFSFTWNQLI
jgi:transposase-like protein